MKQKAVLKRLLSIVLTLCLLLGVCLLAQAGPETATAAVDESAKTAAADPTDAELIAKYHIANDWARPALLFALRKGLLSGKENNDLAPKDPATRAELAVMFMQLLQTQTKASLSSYADVEDGAWYAAPLARAVAAGLLSGTSAYTLSPSAPVTREQAFTMFARAFGLTASNTFSLYNYLDGQSVSSWAAIPMAAMAEAGYISGADRRLEPNRIITRRELAQVFYNVLNDLVTEVPASFTGTLAATTDTVAPGTVIRGDLILCGEDPTVTLENTIVTGRLVVQGCGALSLMLNNCSVKELVLCRPTTLFSKSGIETVTVLHDASTLNGTYDNVVLRASTLINGSVNTITALAGSLTLSAEASAEKLTYAYSAADAVVTIDGQVQAAAIHARRVAVKGTGSIGELTLTQSDTALTCAYDKCLSQPDAGLKNITVTRTDTSIPSAEKPKATISVSFSGGTYTRTCVLLWYLNGVPVSSNDKAIFSPSGTASCEMDFSPYIKNANTAQVTVKLLHNDEVKTQAFTVTLEGALYQQAKNIRTLDVPAKIRYEVNLYSRYGHTYLRSLPAGTIVYHKEYTTYEARVKLKDGTEGWVSRYSYSIIPGDYYVTWDYAKEVKELYVNKVRVLSSKTDYLIWVNLYTQKANIFKGSQGNWKLIRVCPIASGANTMVTVDQLTEIRYKTSAWYFSSSSDYVHHVSVIDYAGRAFHSRLYWTSNGSLKDGTMGKPVSHGCMRMSDEDCTYIYNSIPNGTAVLVY